MPELPVKEGRLSELHLPEIKRDDIIRSLSEIRLPDVDLTKLERPKIDLPDSVSKFEWSDVGKAVAGAAAAANIGRRTSRARWPLAVGGLIIAGLATWAILTNEALRARIAKAGNALRERISAMRSDDAEWLDMDRDEPMAFEAAETKPIEAPAFGETTKVASSGYPEGLGSNNGDAIPAFEESVTRE
jgi:hypothetical protein